MVARVLAVVALACAGCGQTTRTVTSLETVTTTVSAGALVPIPGADPVEAFGPLHLSVLDAAAFVPEVARVIHVWHIAPAAGIPTQFAVEWYSGVSDAYGLSVWQHYGRAANGAHWRRIYRLRTRQVPGIGVHLGDLTGDGHAEMLIVIWNGGSGGCGSRRILELRWGRVRSIYARQDCAQQLAFQDGAFVVDIAGGISFSTCCPTFMLHRVLRWDGARMRLVREDAYPQCVLDGTYCSDVVTPHRPVRFVLRAATWWTRSRGVAIGLDAADPALQVVATTSDAGRTWGLVLATHLRLRRPHVRRGGDVSIVADRCVRAGCFPSRIFSAGGFGRVWDQRGVPSRG